MRPFSPSNSVGRVDDHLAKTMLGHGRQSLPGHALRGGEVDARQVDIVDLLESHQHFGREEPSPYPANHLGQGVVMGLDRDMREPRGRQPSGPTSCSFTPPSMAGTMVTLRPTAARRSSARICSSTMFASSHSTSPVSRSKPSN